MRLWTKLSARSFVAAATVLCVVAFTFSGGAWAQTSQPKGKTSEQPPAAAPPWNVNCQNSTAGLDCRAIQTVFVKRTGQRFLTVAVRMPPDTKKPSMVLGLPLGTYLPAGVSLQFGKDAAKTLPIRSCNRSGCLAEYAVTEAEIGTMLAGADLTVSIQDLQKRPITLVVPANGFAEAYAKIE